MKYGDRVRLLKDFDTLDAPRKGAEGVITYKWPDGMVAVKFDEFEQEFGFVQMHLELVSTLLPGEGSDV